MQDDRQWMVTVNTIRMDSVVTRQVILCQVIEASIDNLSDEEINIHIGEDCVR